jgi:predicted N-formylglutamate amidohydrolase
MTESWKFIAGQADSRLLLIADHASNHVPPGIDLGIAASLLDLHIAVDLGVATLAAALNTRLGMPAILGNISRLVVDFNREEDATHIFPMISDGHAIPGNVLSQIEQEARLARYWRPYHEEVARRITEHRPAMLVSLHSFTPQLGTEPEQERPWEVGILYNRDDRAARIAINELAASGVRVGDQLPYSGVQLNATMNRHGEGNGIPYLGIEMRQDLIGDSAGVARWADRLAPVIAACRDGVAPLP